MRDLWYGQWMEDQHSGLTGKAFQEYKRIYQEEFGPGASDKEMQDSAIDLLKVVEALREESADEKRDDKIQVTDQEFRTLKYLHHAIYHEGQEPTVRGVCAAIGLRSSRSGQVIIEKLMRRGFVYRDPESRLRLSEQMKGCDVKFANLAAAAKTDGYSESKVSLN